MKKPDRASLFFEVADIITLLEHRYPLAAAKLLVEAGDKIARLPDDFDRPLPPEDQDAFIRKLEGQDSSNTPLQDIAWALDKFQARYPRTIARKLGRASKLIQEASELGG